MDATLERPRSNVAAALRVLAGVAVVVILGLVVRAYTHKNDKGAATSAEKAGPQARPVPVQTAKVETRDVPVWLEGLANVAAWQQASVRPQVDGRLERVLFKEGQSVKRGDLLAEIDPRPYLVQLHQAEGALMRDRANLKNAKLNSERYNQLANEKLVAPQQATDQEALVGQGEGTIALDQAAVESARLNLDYARVKAPFDGIVGVRQIDPGNLVRAADPTGLVVLTQLDPAAVFVTVPQDELPAVSAALLRGDVVTEVWSRDGQQKLADGTLFVVDNQINTATGTLRLKARVPNANRRLWPNQFVKARLHLDTIPHAQVVPAQAIQRGPEGTFVYVVGADQKVAQRPVQLGRVDAELAVIVKGLSPGEEVVTEGQQQLRPGATVATREPDARPKKKP